MVIDRLYVKTTANVIVDMIISIYVIILSMVTAVGSVVD